MWRLALGTVKHRWVSLLGSFFALVLGTGILATSILTLMATSDEPDPRPQRFAAARTVVVPADGAGEPLPAPAAVTPATVAAARRAGPVLTDRRFAVRRQDRGTELVGHGWSSASLASYDLASGHAPRSRRQIVVPREDDQPEQLGRRVTLLTRQGAAAYTIVGTVGRKSFEDAVFFTDPEAARISPAVNALAVDAPAGVVRKYVSGDGIRALSGGHRRLADRFVGSGLGKARSIAQMTTALSVLVVAFVLVATFAFIVDQRSRELALLRLVGASPSRIRGMIRTETVLVAAAAALLGCGAGIPGARLMRSWMVAEGMAPESFHVGFDAVALVIAFTVGVCAAVAGSAAAAWRASRVRPLDALREADASPRVMSPLRWTLGGLVLLAAATVAGVIAVTSPSNAAKPGNYFEVPILCAAGLAILSPVLVRPVVRAVTRPLIRFGPVPMLLRQGTLNGGRRVAALVTPVVLAVGMYTAMMCMESVSSQVADDRLAGKVDTDYVATPVIGSTFNHRAIESLRHGSGVRATEVAHEVVSLGTAHGKVIDIIEGRAIAPSALGDVLTPRVLRGSLHALPDDAIVVSDDLASSNDLRVGQAITAWTGMGRHVTLRVGAVVDSVLGGADAYVPNDLPGSLAPGVAFLRTAPDGPVTSELSELRDQGVRVETRTAYLAQASQDEKRDTRLANVVVLGITVTFALVAIANTLVMNVAARRRELATLALGGATRRQVVGVVIGEALLTVTVGTVVALVAAGMEIGLQRLALSRIMDHPPLPLPWSSLWQVVPLCAATAVLAALFAAWRVTSRPTVAGLTRH